MRLQHLHPTQLALQLLLTVRISLAQPTILSPGGPGQIFTEGANTTTGGCKITWEVDLSGKWKRMGIDLMSGSNDHMVNLTRVGIVDATSPGVSPYTFVCPDVTPHSEIYFYEFADLDDANSPKLWTSRFTITNASGITTPALNSTQSTGLPPAWGLGILTNNFTLRHSSNNSDVVSNSSISNALLNSTATQNRASNLTVCSPTSLCPASAPCCSEHGICGTGRSCLVGCNPLGSGATGVCMPFSGFASVANFAFKEINQNRILRNGDSWNGNSDVYDFILDTVGSSSVPLLDASKGLALSLTKEAGGTRLSSTKSLLYGNVTARINTEKSVAAGIVTDFTLISGVKDEIVWEFVGNASIPAETNYFWEGDVGNYTSGLTTNFTNGTRDSGYHDYSICWTPEALMWSIDGQIVRTVSKLSTADPTTQGLYHYPQTPSRIQISIWPAGLPTEAPGVVQWSGGLIDWMNDNYTRSGHYASYVESISVTPYNSSLLALAPLPINSVPTTSSTTGSRTSTGLSSTSTTAWWTPSTSTTSSSSLGASIHTSLPLSLPTELRRLGDAFNNRRYFGGYSNLIADVAPVFAYGVNDSTGQIQFHLSNDSTIILDATSTGLNNTLKSEVGTNGNSLTPTSTYPHLTVGILSGAPTFPTQIIASPSPTSSNPSEKLTVAQRWDKLPSAAHIGVYLGGGVSALLILLAVSCLWNKASSSNNGSQYTRKLPGQGTYSQVNEGSTVQSGPIYSGGGELYPGEELYGGGKMPTYQGGYVPSSEMMKQYGEGYKPVSSG